LQDLPSNTPACSRCAISLPQPGICGACLRRPRPFTAAVAALHWQSPVDFLLHRFKYQQRLELGVVLGEHLAAHLLSQQADMPELLLLLCALARLPTCKLANLQTCKLANLRTCKLDSAVALLLLAALIAGAAAADKIAALFELRTVFLFPALYYVLLRLTDLDERARWRIVDGLAAGAAGVALIGLAQYALGINVVAAEGGMLRLGGVYLSPNNVGLYLGRTWPLLLAVAAVVKHHDVTNAVRPNYRLSCRLYLSLVFCFHP